MTLPADPLAWAVKAFRDDRGQRYAKYRRYLAGDHPLEYATPKFRTAFGRLFDAFGYNRCATVIKAHADRLQIEGFGADDETLGARADDLWDRNHMDVREGQVDMEAFGLGDGYLLVEMHPDAGVGVQLWPQRADQIRVRYDEDRPGRVELAAKAWLDEDEHMRLNLYFPGQIAKYRTRNRAPSGIPTSPQAFEPFQPDGDTTWPLALAVTDTVPVFHFGNDARINDYGESELRDVVALQDGLNKTLMDMLITMEFAAFPQRVLINVDDSEEDTQDSIRKFQLGVDRLLTLMGDRDGKPASISEFTAANITQYLDVAESWDVRISRVSAVPVHHLTMSGDFPSGRALRIAEGPFITKLTDRQRAFGVVYAEALRYGLRLEGMDVPAGALRPNWASAAPLSEEDAWDISLAKKDAGLPLRSRLREQGYDPEQIDLIEQEAAEEAARAFALVGDMAPADDEDEDVA